MKFDMNIFLSFAALTLVKASTDGSESKVVRTDKVGDEEMRKLQYGYHPSYDYPPAYPKDGPYEPYPHNPYYDEPKKKGKKSKGAHESYDPYPKDEPYDHYHEYEPYDPYHKDEPYDPYPEYEPYPYKPYGDKPKKKGKKGGKKGKKEKGKMGPRGGDEYLYGGNDDDDLLCYEAYLSGDGVVPQGGVPRADDMSQENNPDMCLPGTELDPEKCPGVNFYFDHRCYASDSRLPVRGNVYGYAKFCVVEIGYKKYIKFTLKATDPDWPYKTAGIFGTNGCHIHCAEGGKGAYPNYRELDGGRVTILAGDYFPRIPQKEGDNTVPVQIPRVAGDPNDPTCHYDYDTCEASGCEYPEKVGPLRPVDPIGLHGEVFLSGFLQDENIAANTECSPNGNIEEFIQSMERGQPYVSVSSDAHNYSEARGNIGPKY